MLVESIAFIAAIFVIAGALLGGLALVCWHTRPRTQESRTRRRCYPTGNRLLWLGEGYVQRTH